MTTILYKNAGKTYEKTVNTEKSFATVKNCR